MEDFIVILYISRSGVNVVNIICSVETRIYNFVHQNTKWHVLLWGVKLFDLPFCLFVKSNK